MSKKDLILDVQAKLKDPSTYLFEALRAQLVKNGVGEGESIIKIIDVLRNETVETYKAKKLQIDEEYLPKLKVLSILSHFYECQFYDLLKLARLLSVDNQKCTKLLLQDSISKLITVELTRNKSNPDHKQQSHRVLGSLALSGLPSFTVKQIEQQNDICDFSSDHYYPLFIAYKYSYLRCNQFDKLLQA